MVTDMNMRRMRMATGWHEYGVVGTLLEGAALRRGRPIVVKEWERGLLFRHGRLVTVVGPGAHRRWAGGFTLRTVDTRPWIVPLPMQEIPTADGVTVKLSIAARVRVADPAAYVTAARDTDQVLYLAVQVALRELVASLSLDDLLTARADVGARLLQGVRHVEELGLVVDQVELKDIVLPAELKRAQAEVLVARAQAVAALERARGETAALRSLANAARMVADNRSLLDLRLLQQLEASKGHTVVIGTPPLGAA